MKTEFDFMHAVLKRHSLCPGLTPSRLVEANTPNAQAVFTLTQEMVRKEKSIRRLAEVYERDKSNGAAKSDLDKALTIHEDLENLIAKAVEKYQRDG